MIEQELRTAILADPTISALIPADAVYPQFLPQGHAKPCITYSFHDGIAPLTHGGTSDRTMYTVTLKVFADTYGDMRAVTRALVSLLNGMSQPLTNDTVVSARVQNVFMDYEDGLELHTTIIDLTMHIREA